MKREGKRKEDDNEDTTSTEGLIEEDDDDKGERREGEDDLDLLDVAFLRDGITLEPETEDSGDDSDGLYNFKDTLGVQQFPIDLDLNKDMAAYIRPPRPSEYLYGKRYTARCIRRVDPSQLPSLMSLKVPPPPTERTSRKIADEDAELSKLVQKLQGPIRDRRRRSPEPRRRRSPERRRHRSRSPPRAPSRQRLHRSPTSIERYRYWTGKEYHSRNRSSDRRRSRHQ